MTLSSVVFNDLKKNLGAYIIRYDLQYGRRITPTPDESCKTSKKTITGKEHFI